MSGKQEQMIATIDRWHKGQYRGDVPATVHCRNVADIAVYAFRATNITDENFLEDIAVVSLGHDLLEDTAISREYLHEQFGERVLVFIDLLTNHQDDFHTAEYMRQIKSAPEEVRIIKYADLIDNTASVVYNLHELGIEWGNNFFKPIMENTLRVLTDSKFVQYAVAADILCSSAQLFAGLLSIKLNQEYSKAGGNVKNSTNNGIIKE